MPETELTELHEAGPMPVSVDNLLSEETKKLIIEAYRIGAKKYGDEGPEYKQSLYVYVDKLKRHFEAWYNGEQRDPEGQHHLAAVIIRADQCIKKGG